MNKEFHIGDEFEVDDKESFKAEIEVFNYGKPEEEKVYYFTYWNNIKNKRIYRICEKEFFYKWRNFVRNECRRRDTESRCIIPSDRYPGGVKCRANCEHCPFGKTMRDVRVSFEAIEDTQEVAYSQEDEILDRMVKEDRKKAIAAELAKLNETDRQILLLFNEGLSDYEIAAKLGTYQVKIYRRRTALIEELKKKLKDF